MKKNNLAFYSHEVGSHNHWKFKLLRKKYSWCGEGKFWALNNLIAESDNCLLDISHDGKVEQIAADLDFEIDEFLEFINYLQNKCKLVKKQGDFYTTTQVQDDLKKLNKIRQYDRERKNVIQPEK
jgi:hypothetical protein